MKKQMFFLLPIFAIMTNSLKAEDIPHNKLNFNLPTGFRTDIPRTNANFDSYKGSKRQKSLSSRANRRKVA